MIIPLSDPPPLSYCEHLTVFSFLCKFFYNPNFTNLKLNFDLKIIQKYIYFFFAQKPLVGAGGPGDDGDEEGDGGGGGGNLIYFFYFFAQKPLVGPGGAGGDGDGEGGGDSQPLQICIGSTIRIGRETWCLPYAGFF